MLESVIQLSLWTWMMKKKYFIFFFIIPALRVNIQTSSHSLWLYDMKYHGGHMKSFYNIYCYPGLCEMRGSFYWDFLLKILCTSWSLWCQHAWVCNPAISRNRNDEEKYFIFFFIIPALRANIQPSSNSLWCYDMKYHGGHMESFYYICCYRGLCEMRGSFYWDFLLKISCTSWSLRCQHAWVCDPAISRNQYDEEKMFHFFLHHSGP